jgi:hypothetical protein
LIHFGFFAPALSNAEGTAKWAEGDAFSAVQSAFYWSSTTFAQEPTSFAWIVLLNEGITQGGFKVNPIIVWPVQ